MATLPMKCLHHPHRIVIVLLAVVGVLAMINGVVGWSGHDTAVTVGNQKPTHPVVQELAVTPPLLTAYDICEDSVSQWVTVDQFGKQIAVTGFQVAHFKQDDHFEGQLVQNQGQANQVSYHLFWRPDMTLQVIIEESRQGQTVIQRPDPHLAQFDNCVKTRKVQEIAQRS